MLNTVPSNPSAPHRIMCSMSKRLFWLAAAIFSYQAVQLTGKRVLFRQSTAVTLLEESSRSLR